MSENEETVNRPSHYTQYEGFEVMDVCRQLRSPDGEGGWFRANVFKYLARAGWKNPAKELEDLQKAAHYLQREIDRVMEPRKGDPLPARKIHCCPMCGDQLYRETDDLHKWICIGRGHGFMRTLKNGMAGAWVQNELKVKSDKPNTSLREPHIEPYPTTISLACPKCLCPLQKSASIKDNFYCPLNHGSMTLIVSNWQER